MDSILTKSVALADAGLIIGPRTLVDLEELVREVAITSIPDEIQLTLGKLPSVSCDRAKMVQVFQNLLQNAFEHGNATEIQISSLLDDGGILLEISNNGISIPTKYKDLIFEQNFTTKKDGGLGLSIVKRIIEAHKWTILLETTNPVTFKIHIPLGDVEIE
jgi:signal transduction histidine kinase